MFYKPASTSMNAFSFNYTGGSSLSPIKTRRIRPRSDFFSASEKSDFDKFLEACLNFDINKLTDFLKDKPFILLNFDNIIMQLTEHIENNLNGKGEVCKNSMSFLIQRVLETGSHFVVRGINTYNGMNILQFGCKHGFSRSFIEKLINSCEFNFRSTINLNISNIRNGEYNSLQLACIYGNTEIVQYLLSFYNSKGSAIFYPYLETINFYPSLIMCVISGPSNENQKIEILKLLHGKGLWMSDNEINILLSGHHSIHLINDLKSLGYNVHSNDGTKIEQLRINNIKKQEIFLFDEECSESEIPVSENEKENISYPKQIFHREDRLFIESCKNGDFSNFCFYFSKDRLEIIDEESGNSPLQTAIEFEYFDIVEFLIKNKANIYFVNKKNNDSILQSACRVKNISIFKMVYNEISKPYKNQSPDTIHRPSCSHNSNGCTPFLTICQLGNINILEMMLKDFGKGIALQKDSHGNSCLHIAYLSGQIETFKFLVLFFKENGLSLFLKDAAGEPCINYVAGKEDIENFEWWILQGLEINHKSSKLKQSSIDILLKMEDKCFYEKWRNIIIIAFKKFYIDKNMDMIVEFVDLFIKLMKVNKKYLDFLEIAYENNKFEFISSLVNHKEFDSGMLKETNLLLLKNFEEICNSYLINPSDFLLEKIMLFVDICIKMLKADIRGTNLIHIAAKCRLSNFIYQVINHPNFDNNVLDKIKNSLDDKNGYTAFHYSIELKDLKTLNILIGKRCYDIFIKTKYDSENPNFKGETVIHLACKTSSENGEVLNDSIFNLLSDLLNDYEDDDVNELMDTFTKLNKATPLHYAVFYKNNAAFMFLINKKVSTNMSLKKNCYSTLHIASIVGNVFVVKYFFDLVATSLFRKKSNDGKLALHLACENGHLEIVNLLCAVKYKTIRRGEIQLIDFEEEISVNGELEKVFKDNDGKTPLHLACENGHTHIVEFFFGLMNSGKIKFDINSKDKFGRTAIDLSYENGHKNVFDFLAKNYEKWVYNDKKEKLNAESIASQTLEENAMKLINIFEGKEEIEQYIPRDSHVSRFIYSYYSWIFFMQERKLSYMYKKYEEENKEPSFGFPRMRLNFFDNESAHDNYVKSKNGAYIEYIKSFGQEIFKDEYTKFNRDIILKINDYFDRPDFDYDFHLHQSSLYLALYQGKSAEKVENN